MKKNVLCLALGLVLSATAVAENRSVNVTLPQEIPSVAVTMDGKQKNVKPSSLTIREKDDKHITVTVFAKKDKAAVTLPLSYDHFLELSRIGIDFLHKTCNLGTEEEYNSFIRWYNSQTKKQ